MDIGFLVQSPTSLISFNYKIYKLNSLTICVANDLFIKVSLLINGKVVDDRNLYQSLVSSSFFFLFFPLTRLTYSSLNNNR